MARKHCFLVCPPLGNMARKQCSLVCSPLGNIARKHFPWFVHLWETWLGNYVFSGLSTFEKRNMARKQCFVLCPPSKNMAENTEVIVSLFVQLFHSLSTLRIIVWFALNETMFPGLSTFRKHGWETTFPSLPTL
jgi:hypothetical protein